MTERKIGSAVVTGASSMIGAHLVRHLLEHGIRVTAVVRPDSRNLKNLKTIVSERFAADLRTVFLDISEIERLKEEKALCDAFFHLSWRGTRGQERNHDKLQKENVKDVLRALRTAKDLGASVFIGAGSQAEFGPSEGKLSGRLPDRPVTAYGRMKLLAENEGMEEAGRLGLDFLFPRILSVYGPGDNEENLIASALVHFLKEEPMAFTEGGQVWDYLYAGDCAEALIALSLKGISKKRYVLGSGDEVTLRDYITKAYEAVSPGIPLSFGQRPYNENQVMYLSADISDLEEDTGYVPETSFEEGISKTAAWFRKNGLT